MKTQQFQHKKAKVHHNISAGYMASYAPQIAKYVCSFIPLYEKVGFASFSMDNETGYWRYQQYVEKIPKFLYRAKTRAEAEETMKAFFKQVNERIENAKVHKQLPEDFPTLFGQYQVLQSVQAIEQLPHSDKAKIWEFRYGIRLPSVDYVRRVNDEWSEILASEQSLVMGNEIVIRFSGNHLIDVQYSRLPMHMTKSVQMFNLLGEPDTVEEYQKTAKVILKAFPQIAMILPFVQAINGELLGVAEESVAAMRENDKKDSPMPFTNGVWILPMNFTKKEQRKTIENYLYYKEGNVFMYNQKDIYDGDDVFVMAVRNMLIFLLNTEKGKVVVENIAKDFYIRIVFRGDCEFNRDDSNVVWTNHVYGYVCYETLNGKKGGVGNKIINTGILPPVVAFFHELVHAHLYKNGEIAHSNEEEYIVSNWESPLIDELNQRVNEKNKLVADINQHELWYGKRSCYDCLNLLNTYETTAACSQIPKDAEVLQGIRETQTKYKLKDKNE